MWGFERRNGRSVPVTRGVVVFKKDAERIKQESVLWQEEQKKR